MLNVESSLGAKIFRGQKYLKQAISRDLKLADLEETISTKPSKHT